MDTRVTHKMIKDLCGTVSFKRGDSFYRGDKVTFQEYNSIRCKAVVVAVEEFHVTIEKDGSGLARSCSCPTLGSFQKDCQHIAAVLLAICDHQQQGTFPPGTSNSSAGEEERTAEFLNLFQGKKVRTSSPQRHFENRTVLDVTFHAKPVTVGEVVLFGLDIKIQGTVIPDVRHFLQMVKDGKSYRITPTVRYEPASQCFTNETDGIVHQLIRVVQDERVFLETLADKRGFLAGQQTLLIPPSSWIGLAPLLKHAMVTVEQQGSGIKKLTVSQGPPPIRFVFEKMKDENYQLQMVGFEHMVILQPYSAVLSNGTLYELEKADSDRLAELRKMLATPGANTIPISHNQIHFFLKTVVPGLKKIGQVQLSSELSQELRKVPLVAKLYLDRLKNRLLAGIEFHYDHVVIHPLENRDMPTGPIVVRDLQKEEEILELMKEAGFSVHEGGYSMQNEMLEYEFLYHVMPKLQKLVQTYATTAVRMRIVREPAPLKIRVKVKKERTNWLEFKFEMTGIAEREIRDILAALEEKRKYYRLSTGSLMSLETREMEEIQRFLKAVPQQEDDYRTTLDAPILDSLRLLAVDEENGVYTIEDSFRQFLDTIKNPGLLHFEVPPPLALVLRDYQNEGFQWMKTLAHYGFGGVLADDMGLGKTVQGIAYMLSELPNIQASGNPCLIVCPSSLTYNWLQELTNFAPELQAVVMDGTKEERRELQRNLQDVDVIITSYPLLRRELKWMEKQLFHTVIFDEAQAFKNPMTQTARAVKRIQAVQRFGLTGTPIENSVEELWAIYHVIFPQLFQGLQEYSHLSTKTIARRVRPFLLRRMKKDVLGELPEKWERVEATDLLPEQKKLYAAYLAKLRHDTLKHLDKETVQQNRIRILAGLTRLRQICCHPALFVDGYKGSSAKFEQLLQIVEEAKVAGKRVLIFSQFTKMLGFIGRELAIRGQDYFYLDGQTPSEERVELCHRFNDGERDLFLISLKAGGTGLNLTGADTVILYDLWWNPAVEEQAADRAHRMGQKNTVEVIKLVARHTIEEKMNDLQARKKELISGVLDPKVQTFTSLTEEDILEILT